MNQTFHKAQNNTTEQETDVSPLTGLESSGGWNYVR